MELVIKIIINIMHILKKLCKSRILLERMVFNWHFKGVQWKYVASNTRFASKFILHWQPHKYGVCAKLCLDQQLSKKHLVSCFESIIQIFHSHFTFALCPAGRCVLPLRPLAHFHPWQIHPPLAMIREVSFTGIVDW